MLVLTIRCAGSLPHAGLPSWHGTFIGGSAIDDCDDVAVDREGSVYLVCHVTSRDLPGISVADDASDSGMNAYVIKLAPDLSRVDYAVLLAGNAYDGAFAVAVNQEGHAFVAGLTGSRDFPVTANALQPAYGGGEADAFLVELDPAGVTIHATYLGGSDTDQAFALQLEDNGSLLVGGATWSTDFPGLSSNDTAGKGDADAFIARVTLGDAPSVRAITLGGGKYEKVTGIAANREGDVFVAGLTESPDFAVLHALYPTLQGPGDGFVAKLARDNLEPLYTTLVGGSGADAVWGIDLLNDGRPVIAGGTDSPDLPTTPGVPQQKLGGEGDAFVAVLGPDGSRVEYCTYLGGSGEDSVGFDGSVVRVDSTDHIWIAGLTASTDFPTAAALQPQYGGGDQDGFVAALHIEAGLKFATYVGGDGRELAEGLTLASDGAVWVTGLTNSQRLPFPLTFQSTYAGGRFDSFLVRIGPQPAATDP